MIELFEEDLSDDGRKSSKGNQLKWKRDGIWYKADFTGYEGLSEYLISHLLSKSTLDNNEFLLYEPERIKYKSSVFNCVKSLDMLRDDWQIITLERLFLKTYGRGLNSMIYSEHEVVYVLFECFLLGAVISLTRAAKYEPDADVDYIIILGCAIRKDGTLFPLIKGRVDRAIALYKKQLQATGKKAVFVPSGGRGRNEVISEGEAMKRYLIEQGISEEQIMPETESANTAENMRFSRRLIEERSKNAKVVFSTTNYHVFRSGVISRQAGFEPDGIGAPGS